jgi:hypothetical protein
MYTRVERLGAQQCDAARMDRRGLAGLERRDESCAVGRMPDCGCGVPRPATPLLLPVRRTRCTSLTIQESTSRDPWLRGGAYVRTLPDAMPAALP